MDYEKLAELLFPEVKTSPRFWIEKYQPRTLKEGAEVTRIAPSPTGFVHMGTLYTCMIDKVVAQRSGGVCYIRIEDTDKKREVQGAATKILRSIESFGIKLDEGAGIGGEYGPYVQSERTAIYKTFAKELVKQGKAYPCFCTGEQLQEMRAEQEKNKDRLGYYGKFAKCRNLTLEQVKEKIQAGESFVLRFRCPYTVEQKMITHDIVRGEREIPHNENDVVILKSDGIPPYNLAHVVDDFLMKTTLVIRGDEWLPSLSEHLQLFEALGFEPPKYAHLAPLQKVDENGSRRKLSKRKDPEANVDFFAEKGYPFEGVQDYFMTLANSGFEDWRLAHPDENVFNFPFDLKKTSLSGALFDLAKLEDICKNYISHLSAVEVYTMMLKWAEEYDSVLAASLKERKDYWIAILNIERETAKPRKDFICWKDVFPMNKYMFSSDFDTPFPSAFNKEQIGAILQNYPSKYNPEDDQQQWFERIKDLSEQLGFAREVKIFKQNPEKFAGHCGDVSTVLRVALTGRTQTPNLFDICRLLGKKEITARCEKICKIL